MKQVCFVQTRPSVMNLKSFKEARIKLNLDRSVQIIWKSKQNRLSRHY